MGGGEKLAGAHGSCDSGHSDRKQIRVIDLRVFANSIGYLYRDGEHIGVVSHGGAMAGGVGCSWLRCSRAQYDERRAREELEAHHESNGGGRGVREGFEGTGQRWRQWLEREGGRG